MYAHRTGGLFTRLVIALKKIKKHEDKMTNVLAKEEALVGARKKHNVVVK